MKHTQKYIYSIRSVLQHCSIFKKKRGKTCGNEKDYVDLQEKGMKKTVRNIVKWYNKG